MLTVFKYLSLLRSSKFPSWYQREISMMHQTRFRFKEKSKPESYAVWISTRMEWPVPRDFVLTAPQLCWEWDESDQDEGGLKQVMDTLETLTIDRGRVVMMATAEEHKKVAKNEASWEMEPVYGTNYKVEKLDNEFLEQVGRWLVVYQMCCVADKSP